MSVVVVTGGFGALGRAVVAELTKLCESAWNKEPI
jgi:uncharacterized protein YbjT (DUF2867 family)